MISTHPLVLSVRKAVKEAIGKSSPVPAAGGDAANSSSGLILWAGTSCGVEHWEEASGGMGVTGDHTIQSIFN